ncbi:MAG: YdcF family protein [Anaerolineae bacterium]|nr:YdcF family protein [Anaerolineae bacterium]
MRRFRPSRRVVLRILLVTFAIWLLVIAGLALGVILYGHVDNRRPSDVIIVLGAGLRRDNQPNLALIRRSEQGAELYHEGIASSIICSGGYAIGRTRSEADACREILERSGVPTSAIIMEEQSRSTEENALYSHQIMNERGWQTAVIVSDGYHMLRAQWIFTIEGIDMVTSPAPTRPRLSTYFTSVAREIVALHWQVVKEILHLPYTYVPML